MTRTDANPPMMPYTDEYTLVEVDAEYLNKAVKPKQFIHIDQSECIMCEGCVDICPWKCIHMVATIRCSSSTTMSAPAAPCALIGAQPVSSSLERSALRRPMVTPTNACQPMAMGTGCDSVNSLLNSRFSLVFSVFSVSTELEPPSRRRSSIPAHTE